MANGRWQEVRRVRQNDEGRYDESCVLFRTIAIGTPRRLFFLLDVILREAAPESLLFGEVIGIVQGRQVRNPFFRFFATL